MVIVKKICEECKKEFNKLYMFKNVSLCYWCYRKRVVIIPDAIGRAIKTVSDVLDKVYEVGGYVDKKSSVIRIRPLSFPQCMIGRKFKIVLVDEEDEDAKVVD